MRSVLAADANSKVRKKSKVGLVLLIFVDFVRCRLGCLFGVIFLLVFLLGLGRF